MRFLSAWHSDIGIKKASNQDSLLLLQADTPRGPTLLAVVCDGLGGLEKGEVASAAVVRAFSDWFRYVYYPNLLERACGPQALQESWSCIVSSLNENIARYGRESQLSIGTTLEALLLLEDEYYIFHIGDCRVYLKEKELRQLTKDQTFVQQQIDRGAMTQQQALQDARRNVLLQCIGASAYLQPDFITGKTRPGQSFLLCSDGFRHRVSEAELGDALEWEKTETEQKMKEILVRLTERCKQRGESDNITAVLIRVES